MSYLQSPGWSVHNWRQDWIIITLVLLNFKDCDSWSTLRGQLTWKITINTYLTYSMVSNNHAGCNKHAGLHICQN